MLTPVVPLEAAAPLYETALDAVAATFAPLE